MRVEPGHRYEDLLDTVPRGWHKAVTEFLDALGDVPGWDHEYIRAFRDKYGGLRIDWLEYSHSMCVDSALTVEHMMNKVSDQCYRTCQHCGSTDRVGLYTKRNGWTMTWCKPCANRGPA